MRLKLETMTTEQKIGMLLCARAFEDDDVEYIINLIKNHALGCVQGTAQQPEIMERILAAADYPLLVINDTEQGFPTSSLPKIPLNSLSACDEPKYIEAFAKGIVHDAKAAGFNGTWGPVIDFLNYDSPGKVHRVFSDQPERVARLSEIIAKIYKQNHYLSCGKHFPGVSGMAVDTHMQEGFSDFDEEYVRNVNLMPYKYLLERGLLPTVMVGHTVFHKIDPVYPASLSKKVIDILREIGFDGLLFTDSFAMMGILQRFGEENIYGMAIAAGNDIVLPNYRSSVQYCYETLLQNYRDGAFTEERLNEAVRRVLAAMDFVGEEPENPTEFTEEDARLLDEAARDCICAVADEGVSPALSQENPEKLFVVLTPNRQETDEIGAEVVVAPWYNPEQVAEQIREDFPKATVAFIPEFSNAKQHQYILNLATKFREVVVVTFCNTGAYMGTDGLTRRSEAWINALQYSGKISALVHFGNPHAVKTIHHIARRIFGFTIPASQRHAIDVLAGKIEAKGKFPFAIKFD